MCGRYSNAADEALLAERFGFPAGEAALTPRYNQAPGQDAAVVTADAAGRRLAMMRWGLVPSWARDPAQAKPLINARAETLAHKPSFKNAYKKRRCLVLADGFYEWRKGPGGRRSPWRFALSHGAPFAMAGLWEPGRGEGQSPQPTFTIVTTDANELVGRIHPRMPVILLPQAEEIWLDESLQDPEPLGRVLAPYPAEQMTSYQVSPKLNSAASEGPELIRPASEPEQGELGF